MATATVEYKQLLMEKSPKVIHGSSEHRRLRSVLEQALHKPELTKAEQDYCELLSVLIDDYEKKTFAIRADATPVDVLKELMAANHLQQKDLLDVFKHKGLISEILHGRRPLSVEHIRRLARRFHVSPSVFI